MTVAGGIAASLFAPLLEAVGFLEWDRHWKYGGGSAFALNLYKCNLAALWFLMVMLWLPGLGGQQRRRLTDEFARQSALEQQLLQGGQVQQKEQNPYFENNHRPYDEYWFGESFTAESVFPLMLASLLGIVVGDGCELQALRLVGARRVLVVVTLKPFFAALLGNMMLDESIASPAALGMLLTAFGVYMVLTAGPQQGGVSASSLKHAYNRMESMDSISKDWYDKSPYNKANDSQETVNISINSMMNKNDSQEKFNASFNSVILRPLSRHNLLSCSFDNIHCDNQIGYLYDDESTDSDSASASWWCEDENEDISPITTTTVSPLPSEQNDNYDGNITDKKSKNNNVNVNNGHASNPKQLSRSGRGTFGSASSFMSTESECGPPPGVGRERRSERSRRLRSGYVLAFTNVMLDSYGSILIKRHGTLLSTYEINFVRYGFAGAVLLVVSVVAHLTTERQNVARSDDDHARWNGHHVISRSSQRQSDNVDATLSSVPWFELPRMTIGPWSTVSLGVFFVTFLCPTLQNFALFEISLALAVTLNSTTPLYTLPLSWIMNGEVPSKAGFCGALSACAGVVVLCLWGIEYEAR